MPAGLPGPAGLGDDKRMSRSSPDAAELRGGHWAEPGGVRRIAVSTTAETAAAFSTRTGSRVHAHTLPTASATKSEGPAPAVLRKRARHRPVSVPSHTANGA